MNSSLVNVSVRSQNNKSLGTKIVQVENIVLFVTNAGHFSNDKNSVDVKCRTKSTGCLVPNSRTRVHCVPGN